MKTNEIVTMIAEILASLAVITGAIVFIVKWCFNVNKRISKIEDKIERLPLEIESSILKQLLPFAINMINTQNNPLSPEDIEKMRRLMRKLQDNTITIEEANTLKGFLEIEKEEAEQKNNSNLLLAIGIALGAIALIFAFSNLSKK